MSQQDIKEFTLIYETINVKHWDPKVNTRPTRISYIEYWPSLKQAFDRLLSLDKRSFNEELSIKQQLPQIIERAAIFDEYPRLLIMSRHIPPNPHSDLKDGLYLEINTKVISKENFEKEMGYDLGPLIKKGWTLDYFLLPNTSYLKPLTLNPDQRELLRRIHKGPRKMRGREDDGKGIKM